MSLYLNLYDFMNLYQDQAYQEVPHLHLLWINAPLHIKDIISDIQSSPGINAPLHIKHIISDIQSSPACNPCQHPQLLLLWEILVFFAISLLGWKLKSCIGILPQDSDYRGSLFTVALSWCVSVSKPCKVTKASSKQAMLALFLPGPENMCKTCATAFVETPCWSFRA